MSTIPGAWKAHIQSWDRWVNSCRRDLSFCFLCLRLGCGGYGKPIVMTGIRLNLDRYVPGLLTFVSSKLSRGASAVYRNLFGIGITEWRILSLLALEPGIPAQRRFHVLGFHTAWDSRSTNTITQDR